MGYACPVCDAVVADGVHLANHLAVTASLGRTAHLEWLDEHAPEWDGCTPTELAAIVRPHAAEVDTPAFDDVQHADTVQDLQSEARQTQHHTTPTSDAVTTVLTEARELTRKRLENADENPDDPGAETEEEGQERTDADSEQRRDENA